MNVIIEDSCIACGACLEICPVGAISWDKNGKSFIDVKKCIKCHSCESICPVEAIEIQD